MFSGCLPPKIDLRNYKIRACEAQLPEEFELPKLAKIKS